MLNTLPAGVLWLALAAGGDQDPQPGRGLIEGTAGVSVQPASSETYHRVSPNLSGQAFSISLQAGGFLSKSLALEGELVFAAPISAAQRFSYNWTEDYIAENRDVLLNELVRWKPGGASRLEFLAGGGVAVVRARKLSHTISYPFTPLRPTARIPDQSLRKYRVTLTGGVDVAVPVSRRLAFVPTFRLRWIDRPDPAIEEWNGVSAFAFQIGAGLRARF